MRVHPARPLAHLEAYQEVRPEGVLYAEGKNYRIVLQDRIATCGIWARPDLSRVAGAECAEETADMLRRLAEFPTSLVEGCLMDLSRAPKTWGPITHRALEKCCRAFERADRRLAILTGYDAEQRLRIQSILKEHAPTCGFTAGDREAVGMWLVRPSQFPPRV